MSVVAELAPRLRTATRTAQTLTGLGVGAAFVTFHARVRHDPLASLLTGSARRDPYPTYERLRAQGPLARSSMGNLIVTDYATCEEVLRSRNFGVENDFEAKSVINLSILELDPPDHTRLRRMVAPAFSPGRMRRQEERIANAVERLTDQFAAKLAQGPADLMTDFAKPLPVIMITALMGIPDAEVETLTRYGDTVGKALDGVYTYGHYRRVVAADKALNDLFGRQIDLRRREPGDDVVSDLVPQLDAGHLTEQELRQLCILLLVAGFETTVNLIGNAMATLLQRPEVWARLVDDPDLAERAIHETLRWDSPVQMTARTATQDVEVAGESVPKGSLVMVTLAAANRDPQVFDHPDAFDIDRTNAHEHLSFGQGIHHCIGRPLAMIEARLALAALARKLPGLRPAGDPQLADGLVLRGRASVPVRL